ncbi:MAG: hypothetical protein RL235_933, partial [Chlamydiota bacterium]
MLAFPVLWRYILFGYLKIFSISVFTFIAVLLVSRFKEIARFAALSTDFWKALFFTIYQIPLILPIALPISALIASVLLMQRLSRSHELTALRASGVHFPLLFTPLLFGAFILSLLNFSFCSSISPYCRRESKALFYHHTSTNPLLLMQRQQLVKVKHAYLNMDVEQGGKVGKNFVLIAHNESNQRLSLIGARKLRIAGEQLYGQDVVIVSHLPNEARDMFDSLVIENQANMSTSAPVLSAALKKKRPKLEANALDFRMLILRGKEKGKLGKRAAVELFRRISLSLAVLSFTFLGAAFAIDFGRLPSKEGILKALGLTLCVIISYLFGKELKGHPIAAGIAMLMFH